MPTINKVPVNNKLTVEYRVRPVTRYIITRYESTQSLDVENPYSEASCEQYGEFDHESLAIEVMYSLFGKETTRNYPFHDLIKADESSIIFQDNVVADGKTSKRVLDESRREESEDSESDEDEESKGEEFYSF